MNPMDQKIIRAKAVENIRVHLNKAEGKMIIGEAWATGVKKGTLLSANGQMYKVVKIDEKGTTLTLKPYRVVSWLQLGIIIVGTFTLGILLGQVILWWIR